VAPLERSVVDGLLAEALAAPSAGNTQGREFVVLEGPGQTDRYGFRVPAGVVSPFARKDYVSHVVHDHTSILKLVETKWNLPVLTNRDAAADDLLDSVDLHSPPAFLKPPKLAAGPDPALQAGCLATGPGTIPPAGSVTTS
jgi:phospholipase C